jgi:hypothetical protein
LVVGSWLRCEAKANDGGGSESSSTDNVKCSCGNKQDKETAMESRRRRSRADTERFAASTIGKDVCDDDKPDSKGAEADMSLHCNSSSWIELFAYPI